VVFERWSDSAASYIVLDSNKPAVYKQLYRAAKAKLKLRIKVTYPVTEAPVPEPFNSNTSTETLLPPYASTTTLPTTILPTIAGPSTESPTVASVPLEKVSEAVVAYLEGEEGRSKLRTTIGEEVEKEIEKRNLVASVANIAASVQAAPAQPKTREVVKQVYAVYCNICSANVDSVHYHCGICDGGDFDLCSKCVESGKHCEDAEHWMIKRTIANGEVISSRELIASTTAIVSKKAETLFRKEEEKVEDEVPDIAGRTCNCCCEDYEDNNFVECKVCPDYDLCLECLVKQNHGHDPSHSFQPATDMTVLTAHAKTLLGPGKNFRHFAICDGCDKQIYGVRHKCFICPDWDYCSDCYKSAKEIHPGHRFAPIYEALADPVSVLNQPQHYGVYCDGLHCSTKGYCSWIVGVRYKCAICPDFDLCAACEASPTNKHNPTHPLIKLKTPVRNVTVQTLDGESSAQLGDKVPSVTSSVVSNASTVVANVAEAQPKEETGPSVPSPTVEDVEESIVEKVAEKAEEKVEEKIEEKPEEKVEEKVEKVEEKVEEKTEETVEQVSEHEVEERYVSERGDVLIVADFVKQEVADGTVFKAGEEFTQTWTLSNHGYISWPVGTTIKFLGGDNMLGQDMTVTVSKTKSCGTVDFSLKLVAPAPSTRHLISYWGLVTSDGVRFGPQLWCDIEVKPEELKVAESEIPEVVEVPKEQKEEVNDEVESNIEDEVVDLIKSHTSQMIFPTLEKESPANSTANIADEPVEVSQNEIRSSAASIRSVIDNEKREDDVISEVYSVDDLDDEFQNFISDEEDYEVWEASEDEEFGSSTNGSTGSRA